MFNWLKTKVQDVQIAMSYPAYEAVARAEHMATAGRQYCTEDLEREISRLMTIPLQEIQLRYLEPIAQLGSTISRLSAALAGHQSNIHSLDRSYKSELDPLYVEVSELRGRIEALLAEKSEAHDDMNQAREDIDSWHSQSSGTFFGNGGKKLPNHSLFGQSFGDLEGYKSDREAAYSEIERCGNEIGTANTRMNQLRSKIAGIKTDRQRMFDLRKQGLRSGALRRTAGDIEKRLKGFEIERSQKEAERAEFLEAARHRTGVVSLERAMASVVSMRNEFIRSFDQTYAKTDRKLAHRSTWLRDHGA